MDIRCLHDVFVLHSSAQKWQDANIWCIFSGGGICPLVVTLAHIALFDVFLPDPHLMLLFSFSLGWKIQASFTGEDNPLEFTLESCCTVCGGSGQEYALHKRTLIQCRPVWLKTQPLPVCWLPPIIHLYSKSEWAAFGSFARVLYRRMSWNGKAPAHTLDTFFLAFSF